MKAQSMVSLLLAGFSMSPLMGRSAQAQPAATPGFVANIESSVPGCPGTHWRLSRNGNDISGIAFFNDASGASEVKGTADQSGAFNIQVTSTMGKGPSGTVTGARDQITGGIIADFKGEGCSNGHFVLEGVPDIGRR